MGTLDLLADLLDTANTAVGYRWLCDHPACDGEPHTDWAYKHARTTQHPPAANTPTWLILSGRGWGKTHVGAETFADRIIAFPEDSEGRPTEWLIAGETFSDTRKICVEGPSGFIRALRRRGVVFVYNKSLWQITFATGQVIHLQGGDDPDCGRGFNLAGAWLDEVAKWRYFEEAWADGISFALRVGDNPQAIVTTTPKPKQWMRAWLDDPTVAITQGSTFENAANLPPLKLAELRVKYEGTRRGRQELYGEYLDDVEGALWSRSMFEAHRKQPGQFDVAVQDGLVRRIVIGVDPAVTSGEDADETGIIAAALLHDGRIWIVDDWSCRESPDGWARRVNNLFAQRSADRVIAEVNNGGELVASVLRTVNAALPLTTVTASRGKRVRAEPIAALYEQGRVSHVGDLHQLEDQLVSWTPEDPGSPDRMDALVWAVTSLVNRGGFSAFMEQLAATTSDDGKAGPDGLAIPSLLAS
jgi:phage terminase large subunit-like protein